MKRLKKTIGEIFAEGRPIDQALRRAVRQAILDHQKAGRRIAVWENGRVVLIHLDAPAPRRRSPKARKPSRKVRRAR